MIDRILDPRTPAWLRGATHSPPRRPSVRLERPHPVTATHGTSDGALHGEAARDAELVHRARDGDVAACRELVRRHLRAAHGVARAILGDLADAEDACQDAFAAVFARLDRCEPAHTFRPWLLQCVRNRAISQLRRRRAHRVVSLGTGQGEVDPAATDDPHVTAERGELRARLEAALATLPDSLRAIVILHDVEGWRHREIGIALGIADGTSRARLFAARRHLRARLQGDRLAAAIA